MPNIGTLPATTYRNEPDQTVYALAGDTISSAHKAAFRRQLPVVKGEDKGILRANAKVTKAFPVGDSMKEVSVNYSAIVPVGVDTAAVATWLTSVVEEIVTSAEVHKLVTAGDIHIAD